MGILVVTASRLISVKTYVDTQVYTLQQELLVLMSCEKHVELLLLEEPANVSEL